jgi:glycosyltransferase involved in cell wall biosynthesis
MNGGIRVLLIAEAANPEWTSVPLEGWSHSRAIQSLCDAHLVTQIRNLPAIARAGLPECQFTAIDSEAVTKPLWHLANLLRGGANKGWTTSTAIQAIGYPYFEMLVWKKFKERLQSGEFDLVHRITPLSPTMPSPIAKKLHRLSIPFILGPLNGGVPWPKQFDSARRKEREWLSYVRGAYKILPGYRSTRRYASAIICGSKATLEQMPAWCRNKCVYVPENAIEPSLFPEPPIKPPAPPLKIAFVGRLVPYKGADMLLEAVAPLILDKTATVDVIGDGPELPRLKELARQLAVESGVSFAGWIPHEKLHERLSSAHIFGFPSIREFGGAVVLEAMALGLVPVVVGYGGPGELVTRSTGFTVPMGDRQSIVRHFRVALQEIVNNPTALDAMRMAGRRRVSNLLTWQSKARQVLQVYDWVLGRIGKPSFAFDD